jgi:hypothetical protein
MARSMTLLILAFLITSVAGAGERPPATVYKSATCDCVEVVDTNQLTSIKRQHSVPERFAGCHTTIVDGYVVEGHVPLSALERLLAERPPVTGISLPGMPTGSPGMTGAKKAAFRIFSFNEGDSDGEIFAIE